MSKHKLNDSAKIIEILLQLGKTLGYTTKSEFPTKLVPISPAVDVAWISDNNQKFPLMIFEVESSATNSTAYNPVKVFAPPNEQFEKPLFFFHIFVTGGEESSRIDDLKNLFGSYNYRTYRLQAGQLFDLIKDILSQHRRLKGELNLVRIIMYLEETGIFDEYLDNFCLHIESLNYKIDLIVSYAKLIKFSDRYKKHYSRHLYNYYQMPEPLRPVPEYKTFISSFWYDPIQLGILTIEYKPEQEKWFQEFKYWQEHSSYMTQIGPHLGLSHDYDQFLLGIAPSYCALIAALMKENTTAVNYITTIYKTIIESISVSPYSMFFALWLIHISASCSLKEKFEFARVYINSNGGISDRYLYAPPSYINLQGDEDGWITDYQSDSILIPKIDIFLNKNLSDRVSNKSPISIATSALLSQEYFFNWSNDILDLLKG